MKAKQQAKRTSEWAKGLLGLIRSEEDPIPPGFLRGEDLEREWKLSRVQIRRLMRLAVAQGLVERRYVRLLGQDGRPHHTPVFGPTRKGFDVRSIRK